MKYVFEFRFYSNTNEKLNYNQPDLVGDDTMVLYNILDPDLPRCNRLMGQTFDYQYSYYLETTFNPGVVSGIFSVYLSDSPNFNVSYSGPLGIYIRKLLVLHFPEATRSGSVLRIYLPNYCTPINQIVKSHLRLECVQDLVLSLQDDYNIELL